MANPSIRVTVIGTGYLGAVHAAVMADQGLTVLGVDLDQAKIDALAKGEAPFFEPGLNEVLERAVSSGRLTFTTNLQEAAEFGDIHFICVGTPQKAGSNAADLRHVNAAVDGLVPNLTQDSIIIGKSTVPAGTSKALEERIEEIRPRNIQVRLAWNPEFLREGHAVKDTQLPDRLVVGTDDDEVDARIREVYAKQIEAGVPYLRMDTATAELVKVAANSFLATKISFINAIAEVCEQAGADVTALANAIGYDERIGKSFLRAGVGFGGGCLPKDIRAFMARAGQLGVDDALVFLKEIDNINLRQRQRVARLAAEMLGGNVIGKPVAVLGAAFKPDSDDVRDSPALDVAATLHLQGAKVLVYDPYAMENAAAAYPPLNYVESAAEAVRDAELVLLLTEWEEFTALDPVALGELTPARRIIDGRNVLDPKKWREAGWTFRGLGRQ